MASVAIRKLVNVEVNIPSVPNPQTFIVDFKKYRERAPHDVRETD